MALPSSLEMLLAAVQTQQLRFHRQPQPPLLLDAQQAFAGRVAATLTYELPQVYSALLAVADGIDWNGVVLYASETRLGTTGEPESQGLLNTNMHLRLTYTPDKDFVYFAESGMDAYRHNLLTNKFEVADRVATSVFETFGTADELFNRLLTDMLLVDDDDDTGNADF